MNANVQDLLAGMMTLDECAASIGKTARTLRYWIASGDGPPVVHIGRVPYIRISSWHAWVERRERGGPAPPKPRKAVSTKRRR